MKALALALSLLSAPLDAQTRLCPPVPLKVFYAPAGQLTVGICAQIQDPVTKQWTALERMKLELDGQPLWEGPVTAITPPELIQATGEVEFQAGPFLLPPGPHRLTGWLGLKEGASNVLWSDPMTVAVNPVNLPPSVPTKVVVQ